MSSWQEAKSRRLGGRLGKTSVADEIRPEMSWLTCLCSVAWTPGTVPCREVDLDGGLQKKGTIGCAPIVGVTLLSFPGEIYSRVLERLQ